MRTGSKSCSRRWLRAHLIRAKIKTDDGRRRMVRKNIRVAPSDETRLTADLTIAADRRMKLFVVLFVVITESILYIFDQQ